MKILLVMKLSNGNLATGSKDKTINIWNIKVDDGQTLTLRGHTDAVTCLAESQSKLLFSGSHDKTIKVWEIFSASILKTLG